MKYYDQHVHTFFSFDSEERFEKYLALTDGYFVSTEHLDFQNPSTGRDDMPDYEAYSLKVEALNKRYNNRVLKGIEIGYQAQAHDQLIEFFKDKDYDLKLFSIHQNGRYDYLDNVIYTKDPIEVMDEYYRLMLDGIQRFHDVNVLAHFEYGIRFLEVSVETFIEKSGAILKEIFTEAVKHNIALELNARSMYQYHKLPLYEYAIDLYKSVGGHLFTIGSDAHSTKYYRYHFEDIFALLKQHGIYELTVFQKGQPIKVAVE